MNAITKTVIADRIRAQLLGPKDRVFYVVRPTPFVLGNVQGDVQAGSTLDEIARQAIPSAFRRRFLKLSIGGEDIPRDLWSKVRPKPGTTVTGAVLPQGGGGKNPFRMIAMLVLAVATVFTAGALAPALAAAIGASVAVAGGLITGVMGIVSSLLLNVLFPAKQPKMKALSNQNDKSSPTYFLQGSRNQSAQFGTIPVVLGRHRMKPYYGSLPYTEIQGDDQYLRMLFVWGHGPLNIEDIRIGETLLTNYDDYEIEHRYGYPGDTAHTLFPGTIYEESFTIEMTAATGWVTRTTTDRAKEISLDIQFPRGLAHYTKKGKREAFSATFEVEYRLAGSSDPWVRVFAPDRPLDQRDPDDPSAVWSDATTSTVRRSLWWQTPAETQYDVRVRKTSGEGVEDRTFGQSQWINLRSFSSENPLKLTGLCTTALRIRASDQLNGIIDQLSGIVTSVLPDYDYLTDTWIERATSNPASLYRAVLQGKGNARPITDARLHLDDLKDWHNENRINNREFNQVRDFQSSVWDCITSVAAAGRASPTFHDGKWSIVIDRPKSNIAQHFTPRNSWGFAGEISYADIPHAFRVRFVNANKDWDQDERIVYDDGYNADGTGGKIAATDFEGLELEGITNPDQIYKDTRFHLAQSKLRNQRYSFYADVENLVCTRGDRIKVAHDVPAWGLATGRVESVILDGSGNATGATLDEAVPMASGYSFAIRFRRQDGSSIYAALVTAPGEQYGVTFNPAIPSANKPAVGDLWMAGYSSMESIDALVLGVKPGKDMSAKLTVMDYAPSVFLSDTEEIPPFDPQESEVPGLRFPVVSNVRSDETVLLPNNDGSLSARIVLTFGLVSYRNQTLKAVEIQYRHVNGDDGAWSSAPALDTSVREYSILNVDEGQTYEIRLRYRLASGDPGEWSPVINHLVIGKTTPPRTPTTFRINNRQLTWVNTDPEVDLDGYVLRYAFGTTRRWEECLPMHPGVWADSPFQLPDTLAGTLTLMIKAIDVAGNVSTDPAIILTNLGDAEVANVVQTVDLAAAGFPGAITGGSVIAGPTLTSNVLSTAFWTNDAATFWNADSSVLFWVGLTEERVWEFTVYPLDEWVGPDTNITLTIGNTSPPSMIEFLEQGTELFWGENNAAVFWSAVDTDLFWTGTVEWVPWFGKVFGTSRIPYSWRVTTPSSSASALTEVTEAAVVFDVPDIIERLNDVVLAAVTGTRLPITKSFRVITNINLTLQADGGTAETVKHIDKNAELGPLCKAFDSGLANVVSGTVDATIQGY